jgi:hypothetical protein
VNVSSKSYSAFYVQFLCMDTFISDRLLVKLSTNNVAYFASHGKVPTLKTLNYSVVYSQKVYTVHNYRMGK